MCANEAQLSNNIPKEVLNKGLGAPCLLLVHDSSFRGLGFADVQVLEFRFKNLSRMHPGYRSLSPTTTLQVSTYAQRSKYSVGD